MAKLNFPTTHISPAITLFRKIVSLVENDPIIKSNVRPTSIRSWKPGDQASDQPFGSGMLPALRLTPSGFSDTQWYSPDSQIGNLIIDVEMATEGLDIADPINLWFAIERVFFPVDRNATIAIQNALNDAGSFAGMLSFTPPSFEEGTKVAGGIYTMGRIKTDYQKILFP